MGLFNSKKHRTSFALFDIDSASVGVALMHLPEDGQPIMYYTMRAQIEPREHEERAEAMIRTLEEVSLVVVTKGAPALRQETGSGHVDEVVVSIGIPWQKTEIRIEAIVETKPFIYSKALLSEITKKGTQLPEGYIKVKESVIATLLNGYETPKPFGKKVTRAEVTILSSLVDAKVTKSIEKVVRKTYHTHALTLTAFAPVAYNGFREVYQHEKDFLVLDISGDATDIVFVKHGILVDVSTIDQGINDLIQGARSAEMEEVPESTTSVNLISSTRNARFSARIEDTQKKWLEAIEATLREAASRHALPHVLFLLADAQAREYLQRLLDSAGMRSLWLTQDSVLRLIAVEPTNFSQFVKVRGEAEGDVYLHLLALFCKTL
jgi:hypothetical protein